MPGDLAGFPLAFRVGSVIKVTSKSVKKKSSKSNQKQIVSPIYKVIIKRQCSFTFAYCMLWSFHTYAFDIKLLCTPFLIKSQAGTPSKAKAFAIQKIMRQKANATVSPDRESKSQFGVILENNFVLSDDGRHVIGPDASDMRRILVEDLSTGASFRFGENLGRISTLFFDQDSRTLLAGDFDGHLVEYDLDLQKMEGRTTKKHGDLEMGSIYSSFGSMGLVFFGGQYNVRVYDLASKKMLPGSIETAIHYIYSLRVCVVDKSRVYLVAGGINPKYSSTRSDLYDLSGQVFTPTELTEQNRHLSQNVSEQVKTRDLQIKKLQKQLSKANTKIQGTK